MHQSPRIRRLYNDLAALERLRSESTLFRFTTVGDPPQQYQLILTGKSLWRNRGKVTMLSQHRVEIKLGASYPRSIPEIRWLTPIFHPNISEIGMVCLGGYGTHWVPSVQLDDLCVMLWDMARYHNYDIRSPYNREAALWVAGQTTFRFPTDGRPLRDVRAASGRGDSPGNHAANSAAAGQGGSNGSRSAPSSRSTAGRAASVLHVLRFIEGYGRGENDARPRDAERRPTTEDSARLSPPASASGQSDEHAAPLASSDGVPTTAHDEVTAEKVDSNANAEGPVATGTPTGDTDLDGDQNDVMILEASPDEVPHATPRPADDEVVFVG